MEPRHVTPASLAFAIFAATLVLTAAGTRTVDAAPVAAPAIAPADFGEPPSGDVPILFNDHTVYATPDLLKRGRVLAALVRGHEIYVPLRSMFEQMGATVSVSADGRTIVATKTGATVSVTLGKAEVVVDGETRPLDVPPMLYRGVLLAPVRVLSEALGAYVQWVPQKTRRRRALFRDATHAVSRSRRNARTHRRTDGRSDRDADRRYDATTVSSVRCGGVYGSQSL